MIKTEYPDVSLLTELPLRNPFLATFYSASEEGSVGSKRSSPCFEELFRVVLAESSVWYPCETIEPDLQPTVDGLSVVFHDGTTVFGTKKGAPFAIMILFVCQSLSLYLSKWMFYID